MTGRDDCLGIELSSDEFVRHSPDGFQIHAIIRKLSRHCNGFPSAAFRITRFLSVGLTRKAIFP